MSARNFGRLAQSLRELASVPARVTRSAAPKIRKLITEQFTKQQDPYGAKWAPLTAASLARGRRPPVLTDTRAMRTGIRVRPMAGSGLAITIPAPYAGYHQTGTSRMVARMVFPSRGLPTRWRVAIQRELSKAVRETMR